MPLSRKSGESKHLKVKLVQFHIELERKEQARFATEASYSPITGLSNIRAICSISSMRRVPRASRIEAGRASGRLQLVTLLDEMRAADAIPWSDKDCRFYKKVFPQMTNWAPGGRGRATSPCI
jgi:hypothetical protein